MLTGARASKDEENGDFGLVEDGRLLLRAFCRGLALLVVVEMEGVRDLVNDGRHGVGGAGVGQASLWRGGTRGWSAWRGWAEAG